RSTSSEGRESPTRPGTPTSQVACQRGPEWGTDGNIPWGLTSATSTLHVASRSTLSANSNTTTICQALEHTTAFRGQTLSGTLGIGNSSSFLPSLPLYGSSLSSKDA